MDSSTEQEDEQFFETLEDIASLSDADSVEEARFDTNSPQCVVSAPFSKYDVWKNSPGSVLERRQRLFLQMGLKVDHEDSGNLVVLVDTAPAGSLPVPSSSKLNTEHSSRNCSNVDCSDDGVSRSATFCAPTASNGRNMVRSRSDGTFSRLQSKNEKGHCLRLLSSGTTSPVSNHREKNRLVDGYLTRDSCSVLPSSNPLFSGTTNNGKSTPSSADGSVVQKLQLQWKKFGRFRVATKNGSSLLHLDLKVAGGTKASALPLTNIREFVDSNDGEVLCRVRGLDSGKKLLVNENKLKELDTGREISLEEFESTLGLSPIVQEMMRRQRVAGDSSPINISIDAGTGTQKKKKGWFEAFKGVMRASLERGSSLQHGNGSDKEEKSSRKSGSATDGSQDIPSAARPVKVRVHKKSVKAFGDLRLRQEIQAHQGAISTMKFSLDGCYLATAGQDRVVKVWEVFVRNSESNRTPTSSGELNVVPGMLTDNRVVQRCNGLKRSNKSLSGRKYVTSQLPALFTLSEDAKCIFVGHKEDILDLSWSPSQFILSSSMDKTVRLWNISSKSCLKIFTHNDYVTCIQFHPLDPGHFISGSLDGKVRIWCIQEPQVIDWVDLQEMVTAACFTPNGQGAVVGSYKGTCRFYKTPGNKLQLDTTFEVCNTKTKRSQGKNTITGFQFVPGDNNKILITTNDSRIRVYDSTEINSKFKGFRNSKSHISASLSRSGRFIICASEDSRVCIWNYNDSSYGYPGVQRTSSGAYEDFSAKDVLVAIPWLGLSSPPTQHHIPQDLDLLESPDNTCSSKERSSSNWAGVEDISSTAAAIEKPTMTLMNASSLIASLSDLQDAKFPEVLTNPAPSPRLVLASKPPRSDAYRDSYPGSSLRSNCVPAQHVGNNVFFSDCKGSALWPEEKLPPLKKKPASLPHAPFSLSNKHALMVEQHANLTSMMSAWGMVIVTGGSGGEMRVFQNYSLPVRL